MLDFFYSSTLFIVISLYCILTSLYFLSSAQQYAKKASVFLHTEELRHPPTERTKERTRVNPRMGTSWARRAGVQRETMVLIYLYTKKAFLNQITIFLFIFDPLYIYCFRYAINDRKKGRKLTLLRHTLIVRYSLKYSTDTYIQKDSILNSIKLQV